MGYFEAEDLMLVVEDGGELGFETGKARAFARLRGCSTCRAIPYDGIYLAGGGIIFLLW
jgi:hypothetical protein